MVTVRMHSSRVLNIAGLDIDVNDIEAIIVDRTGQIVETIKSRKSGEGPEVTANG